MAIGIFNRDYSAECLPGGSTFCDGVSDFCECPCHEEPTGPFADAATIADMQRAHAEFWKSVPFSAKELTRRF